MSGPSSTPDLSQDPGLEPSEGRGALEKAPEELQDTPPSALSSVAPSTTVKPEENQFHSSPSAVTEDVSG